MKKSVILAITLVLFLVPCFFPEMSSAYFQFTTKDGQSFTWYSYTEDEYHYCTWKTVGRFCVLKHDVLSIKEVTPDGKEVVVVSAKAANEDKKESKE